MNEGEFIRTLQQRAKEQHVLLQHLPFPRIFSLIAEWLGDHPWRILIPIAFLLSALFRVLLGSRYEELILRIFGGL